MRQELLSGYILHVRPYKDNAQLVDFFSQQYGLVRGIGYGKQAAKFTSFQLMQTFATGQGGLKRFKAFELTKPLPSLQAGRLYAGMYLNELFIKTLPEQEPFAASFKAYQRALEQLAKFFTNQKDSIQLKIILRTTELVLLSELGFAIDFKFDSAGEAIATDQSYVFVGETGFVESSLYRLQTGLTPAHTILGQLIVAFDENLIKPEDTHWLGLVCRTRIDHILEYKPLASRALWQDLYTK